MQSTLVRKVLWVWLLMFLLYLTGCGGGGGGGGDAAATGAIRVAWDPVTDPRLAGYKLHYGPAETPYSNAVDAGAATQSGNEVTYTLTGLTPGQTYFITVTAYDAGKTESSYSNQISAVAK